MSRSTRSDRVALVAVGSWVEGTGFTRVLAAVLPRLAPWLDVHLVGIGYKGAVRQVDGWTLHPSNLGGGDVFGAFGAAELARELGASLALGLNDIWVLQNYVPAFAPLWPAVRLAGWFPLDGRITDARVLEPLAPFDLLIGYTQFARSETEAAIGRLAERGVAFRASRVAVAGHGVDAGVFRPLAGSVEAQLAPGGRTAVKRRVFGEAAGRTDAFVVLNANRPVPRKRIDLTIDAFARFARGKPPNVKLCLHHALLTEGERTDLASLASRHGVAERVRLSPAGAPVPAAEELNLLYNACDVGLNTAAGEGWGLVSFEHAATGAAQVVPANSACAELWQDAAAVVPVERPAVPPWSHLALAAPDPAAAATELERLYAEPEHLRALSLAGYRNAVRSDRTWDAVAAALRHALMGGAGDAAELRTSAAVDGS